MRQAGIHRSHYVTSQPSDERMALIDLLTTYNTQLANSLKGAVLKSEKL